MNNIFRFSICIDIDAKRMNSMKKLKKTKRKEN